MIVTRRYDFRGPWLSALQRALDPGLVLVAQDWVIKVDVTYDDAISSTLAVDAQMAQFGCAPEASVTTGDPFFALKAPAGTVFKLEVDNSGALTTKVGFPTGYVDGLDLRFNSTSVVDVGMGRCRSDDDTLNIAVPGTLSANIAVAGVNGLDTGSEAASTWYHVWVIADSTGVNPVASLLSVSASAPTMPAGYDKKRRVGTVRNNAGSNFIDFIQLAASAYRSYQYRDAEANRIILAAGAATSRTNISAAPFVPPTSRRALFDTQAIGIGTILYAGIDGASLNTLLAATHGQYELPTDSTQQIAYENVAVLGATSIWVVGYTEAI